jgi:hypothetical protein
MATRISELAKWVARHLAEVSGNPRLGADAGAPYHAVMTPEEALAAAEYQYERGMHHLQQAYEGGNAVAAQRDIAVATAHFAAGQLALMIGRTKQQ